MTNDYINTTLRISIKGNDCFITGFKVSLEMLKDKSIQQIVDGYYVGTDYVYHNEISRPIEKVEILEIKK